MYKDLTNAMGGGIYWVGRDELPVCKEVAIERLEAENAALRGQLDKVKKQAWLWKKRFKLEERANEILTEELLNVTAERDAALNDLRGKCSVCVHYTSNHHEGVCAHWSRDYTSDVVACSDCWQWRGLQKEDDGNDD